MAQLVNRISNHIDHLTKSQKDVANYFLYHLGQIAFSTLEDLATLIGVSPTTIIRFAKEIGYDGFASLQKDAQQAFLNKSFREDSVLPDGTEAPNELLAEAFRTDIQNLEHTLNSLSQERLDAAVQALVHAKRVYILGMRVTFSMAFYTYISWGQIRTKIHLIQPVGMGFPEDVSGIEAEDVCVAFWTPRYNRMTASILNYVRKKKTTVILITSPSFLYAEEYGDIVLPCELKSFSFQNSLVAPMSLINYLTRRLAIECSSGSLQALATTEELLGADFYMSN